MIPISHLPEHTADCSICLDPIATNEGYGHVVNDDIPHLFHRECIVPWYISGHPNCPICRAELGEGELNLSLSERAWKVAIYTKECAYTLFLVLGVAVILTLRPLIFIATIACAIKTRRPVLILATYAQVIIFKVFPPLFLQMIDD